MNKHHTINFENIATQYLNFVELCFEQQLEKEVIEEGIKLFTEIEFFNRTFDSKQPIFEL